MARCAPGDMTGWPLLLRGAVSDSGEKIELRTSCFTFIIYLFTINKLSYRIPRRDPRCRGGERERGKRDSKLTFVRGTRGGCIGKRAVATHPPTHPPTHLQLPRELR